MRLLLLSTALLPACDQDGGFTGGGIAEDSGWTGGAGNGGDDDDDTDNDGDNDGDGFTPEQGDCDDDDFFTAPGLPERAGDGKDNDCDGRIDEAWDGVAVAYSGNLGNLILELEQTGHEATTIHLPGDALPFFLDYLPDGSGWLVNVNLAQLVLVDREANVTVLADYSETDFPPYGVAVAPDGQMYAVLANGLVRVGMDGSTEMLAEWDPDTEFYGLGIATDPLTGSVGVFDYYGGGFSTWNEAEGLVERVPANFDAPAVAGAVSGAHRDGGGWYVPAYDTSTYALGIHRYDDAGGWVQEEEWSDENDWVPWMMTIDGDDPQQPDFYLAATAGWYQTVWRVIGGKETALNFYVSDGADPGTFYGIASRYASTTP
jgi:hypothetical protein